MITSMNARNATEKALLREKIEEAMKSYQGVITVLPTTREGVPSKYAEAKALKSKVRDAIYKCGMSIPELAEDIGVGLSLLRRIVGSDTMVKESSLKRVAKLLGVEQ